MTIKALMKIIVISLVLGAVCTVPTIVALATNNPLYIGAQPLLLAVAMFLGYPDSGKNMKVE